MPFAGFNVTFGYFQTSNSQGVAPLYGPMTGSQNMTVGAGETSQAVAPTPSSISPGLAYPMASVYAAADSWICVGAVPGDPTASSPVNGRRFIPALTLIDFLCNPGDKVRWSLA